MKIRLRRKLLKVFKCVFRRNSTTKTFKSLNPPSYTTKAIYRLSFWARSLKHQAKQLCSPNSSGHGYTRLGHHDTEQEKIPKGHLAVYVGESNDDTHRVLVPVIYFNHPLFGELLKKAEKVIGYDHPGGIQIPCRVAEFENVKTKIACETCRTRRRRKRVY